MSINVVLKTGLIAVIASAVVSIGTVVIKEVYFTTKQQVVTVDLQKLVAAEIQENMKVGVTEMDRQERASKFSGALENALNKVSAEGENIILVAPAVVRGAVDVTEKVKTSIEEDLKKAGK